MRNYWNKRFEAEKRIWGDCPSLTAAKAAELFRKNGVRKILVPGAGYGRHTHYFAAEGFTVHGIEISDIAVELAPVNQERVTLFCGSVLDMPFSDDFYDAVYCFNVLHLFRAGDRKILIQKCADQLRPGGLLFFTVFSEQEPSFGRGHMVEKDTFESKPGRPTHYFSDADLKEHFAAFDLIETDLMEDRESHGEEGPHTHTLRYIISRKP